MAKRKEVLEYHSNGYTVKEIMELTGYTASTVRWAINSKGLKANKASPGKELDHRFQEFILGCILGDGHIEKDNRLGIAHKPEQYKYIVYIREFVSSYELAGKLSYNKIYNDRYKNGYIEEYRFRTLRTDKMSGFRDFYYSNNKKSIPNEEFLNEYLTSLAVAVWFMDDGSRTNYNLQFNTQSFSEYEVAKLRYVLLNKYNIITTQNKECVITIHRESIEKFIDLVIPYFIPSMVYKLIPYRVLYKLGELQERCDANLQPSLVGNNLEGSTTNRPAQTGNAVGYDSDTSAQHSNKNDDIV